MRHNSQGADSISKAGQKVLRGLREAAARAHPIASSAHYEPKIGQVIITLNTGLQFLLDPTKTQGLHGATRAALEKIEITGPGLGVYFPKLDVDRPHDRRPPRWPSRLKEMGRCTTRQSREIYAACGGVGHPSG
jgi:hypothetical protein